MYSFVLGELENHERRKSKKSEFIHTQISYNSRFTWKLQLGFYITLSQKRTKQKITLMLWKDQIFDTLLNSS